MSAAPAAVMPLALELDDLRVAFRVRGRWLQVLRGVSLTIPAGGSYGLVGESGCGKSTTALAIMRYLPRNGKVTSGSIRVGGVDLLAMSEREVRRYRSQTARAGGASGGIDEAEQDGRAGSTGGRGRAE